MSEPNRVLPDGREIPNCNRYRFTVGLWWYCFGDDDSPHRQLASGISSDESCAFAAAWWKAKANAMTKHFPDGYETLLRYGHQADLWQRKFETLMEN